MADIIAFEVDRKVYIIYLTANHKPKARKIKLAIWKKRKIKKWHDGDTPEFTNGEIARLARVRAHEKHQFGGSTATKTAAGMSGRSRGFVYVKQVARDRWRRPVVEIKNKDGSINSRMIKKSYKNKGR